MFLKDLNNFNVANATNATKSTQDSAGQQINTTYIKGLSASGTTITYTKGNGATGTITTQDTNTWRPVEDVLTSSSTSNALTANQGRVLKGLIDGKAAASHGRHVPDVCTTITDWNSATTNGWYMGNNATNAPTANAWYFGEVVAHNANYLIQTVYQFTASSDAKAIPKYIRAKMNGTWGAWTNVTVAKAVPSNAVFTDTNTWRGVQDNLTSTATDQSLSANQGKVLKGLIDGKAAASHGTHVSYGGNGSASTVSRSDHTHNYAGSSSAGGNANAAVKLATARSINGTNFDGTANITTSTWGTARYLNGVSVNGASNYTIPVENYKCEVGDNNTYLYHRILTTNEVSVNWNDKSIIIVMHSAYSGGGFGIAKITFRTNDISSTANASGEIRWLVRSGFAVDTLVFNLINKAGLACMDVFYKSPGTYAGMTWYVLSEGARSATHSNQWTKYNTNASGTNAYTENGARALRSYTDWIVKATDAGHVSTATKLATPRTINGVNFDGSANITVADSTKVPLSDVANTATANKVAKLDSSADINVRLVRSNYQDQSNISGAMAFRINNGSDNYVRFCNSPAAIRSWLGASADHTHPYVPTSGGNISGALTVGGNFNANGKIYANAKMYAPSTGGSWISGMTLGNATLGISTQQTTGQYHPYFAVKTSGNHVANIGGLGDNFGFYGFKSGRTENATDWSFVFNASSGAVTSTAAITAPTFNGSLNGNANTATTLQNARTINGTSFNGSANITTSNWGTARNIYIADNSATNTGPAVSVNGGANATLKLPATIKATTFTGALSGNASTATKLQTARTIAISGTANGSATFDGSGNISIKTNERIFSSEGTSGKSGYICMAKMVITSTYVNRPIEFRFISRGRGGVGTITIAFSNTNNTDPSISTFVYNGVDYGAFIVKSATSTWDLYITKSEAYDTVTLVGMSTASQGITITHPGTFLETKPTVNVYDAGLGSNVGYARTANAAHSLSTARTINGTSFNGSANITTANWGTARTIAIADNGGNVGTGVSVNGSTNVQLKLPTNIVATTFVGNLNGVASSAGMLQTARTINGTSFNGSGNITTANWGTARTITIGNTGKSVNGSANIGWTLAEIGALPLAGGTVTGATKFNAGITTGGSIVSDTAITDNLGSSAIPFNAGYAKQFTLAGEASKSYGYLSAYTVGTTSTAGESRLVLGNSTASGTASNASGSIFLYGTNTGYTRLVPSNNGTSNVTINLPNGNGSVPLMNKGDTSYWGMVTPDGNASNWVRTTSSGLIPSDQNKSSSIGTSSWQFKAMYAETFYGALSGNATTATKANSCTGNSATATTLATARTINGTSFNGSANITTANWGTARTLTIGKTGKSVNGSGNVAWSLQEIMAGQGLTAATACGTLYFNNSGKNRVSRVSCYANSDATASYTQIAHLNTDGTNLNYFNLYDEYINVPKELRCSENIRVNGRRLSITASAPSSPATGDIWIDI